jgi:hypothetical protein
VSTDIGDQHGKLSTGPGEIFSHQLHLFRPSRPQSKRDGTENLHLFPHSLGHYQILPTKGFDQPEGHDIGGDRITTGDNDLR